MDMIDAVVSMVFTVIAAVALKHGWERLFPSDESAADLGYMPGSEAPKCGWPKAILGTVAFVALAGFVFWAGAIVGL